MGDERRGMEASDINLEARLRKIERDLGTLEDGAVVANPNDISTTDSIPQVTGLSLATGVRSITVKWNDTNISQIELDNYEVQFSTVNDFSTNVITYSTLDLQQVFDEGDANTEYFVRVRAVLNSGDAGPYSETLNTSTGQIVADDIADGAISVTKLQTNSNAILTTGSVTVTNAESPKEVQSVTFDTTGNPMFFYGAFEIVLSADDFVTIQMRRQLTNLAQITRAVSSVGDSFGFGIIDTSPGTGTRTYRLRVSVNAGITATVSNRSIFLLEVNTS